MGRPIRNPRSIVADVMSTPVTTVRDTDGYKHVVEVLQRERISAAPVVSGDGTLLGIVSEADLMLKQEGSIPGQALHPVRHHRQQAKAESIFAGQLMTTPLIQVTPDASIADAARLMQKNGVRRLVVVDAGGGLFGIVTRGDLLKVFLRGDAEICDEILGRVVRRDLVIDTTGLHVAVRDGIVSLTGEIERRSDIEPLVRLVHEVDGVVSVAHSLSYRVDDTVVDAYAGYGSLAGRR